MAGLFIDNELSNKLLCTVSKEILMKQIFASLYLIICFHASASPEVECAHKKGEVVCAFNREAVVIGAVINGGECAVPKIYKPVHSGEKFVIPGSKDCFYNRMLWLFTDDGKVHKFYAM